MIFLFKILYKISIDWVLPKIQEEKLMNISYLDREISNILFRKFINHFIIDEFRCIFFLYRIIYIHLDILNRCFNSIGESLWGF